MCLLYYYIFLMNWPFYHYKISLSISTNVFFFLFLMFILSDNSIATPVLFWGYLSWYIFSHHFTFNLSIFFNLSYISFRQHRVRSVFKQSQNLCLFIGFSSFTFNIINIANICHFAICFPCHMSSYSLFFVLH